MTNQKILKKRPKRAKIDKTTENKCPECDSTDFDYNSSRAEIICKRCGCVIKENMVDNGPDWVAYDREQQLSRAHAGAPVTNMLHDYGLSTEIDARGSNFSSKDWVDYYKLIKNNKKSKFSGTRDRNLAFALSQIKIKCSIASLPKIVNESASLIYRNALKKDLIVGRSIEGFVVSSIYLACKQNHIPRTYDELLEISNVTKKEIARISKIIKKELKIKIPIVSPIDYIPRFASQLSLSGETEAKAIEIAGKSKEKGLSVGKPPNTIAAAALYVATLMSGENKSEKEIAEVAGITELTLRHRYKELIKNLDITI